jgi:nucleoside-diphosphate-sugar epimerase
MDMLYMPDALNACTQLMDADPSMLVHRNSFNVTSMSFSPKKLFAAISKRVPGAEFSYDIDPVKAEISASWPDNMDDSCAREEWGWNPQWGMEEMIDDMLSAIKNKQI